MSLQRLSLQNQLFSSLKAILFPKWSRMLLKQIKSKLKIPLNLEIAATKEMLKIATRSRPPFICIVPEKRKEITTEGGLNLNHNKNFLNPYLHT